MEISSEAIDKMLRVQQETGVKLAVISQHRFDPASRRVHDLLEEKAFGRLVLGNAIVPWWRSQEYYDSGDWRGTWKLDGGELIHLGRKSFGDIPCSRINCQSDKLNLGGMLEEIFIFLERLRTIASCLILP